MNQSEFISSTLPLPGIIDPQEQGGPSRQVRERGVLPSQRILELLAAGRIACSQPTNLRQLQPSSLDLRLGPVAYRVRASFLPGKQSRVEEKLRELSMAEISLEDAAIFEKGCVYIVPLMEEWYLPDDYHGKANPKSTTGRLDIFTRLITDYGYEFERVPEGYKGKLYAEVVPRTFSVKVRQGMSLNQLRFVKGNPLPSRAESTLDRIHNKEPLSFNADDLPADTPRVVSVDLTGGVDGSEIVGYRALAHAPLIDLSLIDYYDPRDFWEPIRIPAKQSARRIILNPDEFYILVSKEKVRILPDLAAEMVSQDPLIGEFRSHYAGFFDPGFGYNVIEGQGTRAVLEVRSHEVPFVLEHGQIVGRLEYEWLTETPEIIYGPTIGSSYQAQGLQLSKQFKRW
jgi:dCTP deaminase